MLTYGIKGRLLRQMRMHDVAGAVFTSEVIDFDEKGPV